MADLIYQIALTRIPQVGAVTARQLVSHCGGAREVFSASRRELLRIPGVGPQIAAGILQRQVLHEAEAEIQFMEKNKIRGLFYLDAGYPERLKAYADSPAVLYYRGQADLNAARVVAIVGTRRPSPYGTAVCEELIDGLKPYHPVIISGLAYGIDITAHRHCLESGLPTIGVLGHGLSRIYPAEHRSTALRMAEQGGLLTEYLSYIGPDREHFPMRNRIIAGLCDALIVIETGLRGGSMISAELANSYHKDVFAVPGRIRDKQSQGCHLLIKNHKAALIDCAADVAYAMRWDEPEQAGGSQGMLFVELTEEEKRIVDLIRQAETLSIDQLAYETSLSSSRLASLLLNLEFKGIVRSLPGKRFALDKGQQTSGSRL